MCNPALVIGGAAGLIGSKLIQNKQEEGMENLMRQNQPPQYQREKQPNWQDLRKRNAPGAGFGPGAGPSSTLLTGPGGIDPRQLKLGRSTLLGS